MRATLRTQRARKRQHVVKDSTNLVRDDAVLFARLDQRVDRNLGVLYVFEFFLQLQHFCRILVVERESHPACQINAIIHVRKLLGV